MRKRDLSQLIYDSNKTLKKIDKASISFIYENEWYKLKNTFVLKRTESMADILENRVYVIIDIINVENEGMIDKINYIKQFRFNQLEDLKCGIYVLIQKAGHPNLKLEAVRASSLILNAKKKLLDAGHFTEYELRRFRLNAIENTKSKNYKAFTGKGYKISDINLTVFPTWGKNVTTIQVLLGVNDFEISKIVPKTMKCKTDLNTKRLNIKISTKFNRTTNIYNIDFFHIDIISKHIIIKNDIKHPFDILRLHGNYNYTLTKDEILEGQIGPIVEVEVEIYGIKRTVTNEWLFNLIKYDCKILNGGKSKIYDFRFDKTETGFVTSGLRETTYVTIENNQPFIYADREFKIVPRYSSVAVSKNGDVLHLSNNKISFFIYRDIDKYPMVNIHNGLMDLLKGFKKKHIIGTHRLVANAWVDNPNKLINSVVNHIDGDKHNPYYENLEWVTQKENVRHALKTGLKTGKALPCFITFTNTKSENTTRLMYQVPSTVNVNNFLSVGMMLPYQATLGGYQIRTEFDNRKLLKDIRFQYDIKSIKRFNHCYYACKKGSTIQCFNTRSEVLDYLHIENKKFDNINDFLKYCKNTTRNVVIGFSKLKSLLPNIVNPLSVKVSGRKFDTIFDVNVKGKIEWKANENLLESKVNYIAI